MNRLTLVRLGNPSGSDIYSQYYYDDIGNMLRMYTGLSSALTINGLDDVTGADMDFSVTKYTYDHLSNLETYTDPLGQQITYGNILTKTEAGVTTSYSYGKNNRVETETITEVTQTITKHYTYDPNGNQISVRSEIIKTSDSSDEILEVTDAGNSTDDELTYTINSYNLLNQLIDVRNTTMLPNTNMFTETQDYVLEFTFDRGVE